MIDINKENMYRSSLKNIIEVQFKSIYSRNEFVNFCN